jgi:predicted amidophosphoribosyltransferase
MPEPTTLMCDRCERTFDTIKIVQGIYGTRHCNKCINELRRHEIRERAARWARPEEEEKEDRSISIHEMV